MGGYKKIFLTLKNVLPMLCYITGKTKIINFGKKEVCKI